MAVYLQKTEVIATRLNPLYCHKHNLQQTRSGYGRKLALEYQVQLTDKRWRRVYICCYSNVGTAYVLVKNEWRVISLDVEEMLQALR